MSARGLAEVIVLNGWYKQGDFMLSSGKKATEYVDLRPCILSTRYSHLLSGSVIDVMREAADIGPSTLLCGVVTSGLVLLGITLQRLSTMISMPDLGGIYVRTKHRTHGSLRDIEGEFKPGQEVIILDDVATTGGSLTEVIEILFRNKLLVAAAVVVVDRDEGAKERLAAMDVLLYSVLTLKDIREVKES